MLKLKDGIEAKQLKSGLYIDIIHTPLEVSMLIDYDTHNVLYCKGYVKEYNEEYTLEDLLSLYDIEEAKK